VAALAAFPLIPVSSYSLAPQVPKLSYQGSKLNKPSLAVGAELDPSRGGGRRGTDWPPLCQDLIKASIDPIEQVLVPYLIEEEVDPEVVDTPEPEYTLLRARKGWGLVCPH
jgi:hypothetical protein